MSCTGAKKNKGGRPTAVEEAKKGVSDILILMEKMAECGVTEIITTLPGGAQLTLNACPESLAAAQWKKTNTQAPLTDKGDGRYNQWEQSNLPDKKEEILPSVVEDLDRLQLENPAEFERIVTDERFLNAVEQQLQQES